MRKLLLVVLCLIASAITWGQTDDNGDPIVGIFGSQTPELIPAAVNDRMALILIHSRPGRVINIGLSGPGQQVIQSGADQFFLDYQQNRTQGGQLSYRRCGLHSVPVKHYRRRGIQQLPVGQLG